MTRYFAKVNDETGETLFVARWGDDNSLERWDGNEWVDFPGLLDATGIGGAESYDRIGEAEVLAFVGGQKGQIIGLWRTLLSKLGWGGEKAYATSDRYRSGIRSAVRGLWTGNVDWDQFFDMMMTAVRAGITGAWYTGAGECGIDPADLSMDEKLALEDAIAYENQWITGFANHIEQNDKASGGKLEKLWPRAEIWIGRWEGVRDKAKVMACGDKKLEWVQGPTSDKCSSCSRLNGKVKRASYWKRVNVLPRVHGVTYLDCKGFRCLCELLPTEKPQSKGPLPKLP